jgi:hypothetical protein
MDIEAILNKLRHERDQIDRAIQALEGSTYRNGKRPGRKRGSHMSAEARARMSAAQKKRWAKLRRELKEKTRR